MLKVGLTGGIGSGKSTVAKIFEVLGIPVYYADAATKKIMNTDRRLKAELIKHFGEQAYTNNELNRAYIASIVFADPEKLALLNSLTHPATIRDANHWMEKQSAPYVIKEAALLFESGADQHLDHIIGVSSPEELRIRRVMERDKAPREEVLGRLRRQMPEEEKISRCDSVILNDESELLIPQVLRLHEKLLKMEN